MTTRFLTNARQISIIVKDLRASMKIYNDLFGIGPWVSYHFTEENMRDLTYLGKPAHYGMEIGISHIGDAEIELIQPLYGESCYADFLREHGEGLHHICFDTDDYHGADAALRALGYPMVLSGVICGLTPEDYQVFSYYDCREKLGFHIELYHVVGNFEGLDLVYDNHIPSTPLENKLFTGTRQFAVAVNDLPAYIKTLQEDFGFGPWECWHYNQDTVADMKYRGKRLDHAMDIGVTPVGIVDLELLQPLTAGNTYDDFIREHGQGLHHLCMEVEDFDRTDAALRAAGCPKVQEGTVQGTYYAYYDCREKLGFYVELYRAPFCGSNFDALRFDCGG